MSEVSIVRKLNRTEKLEFVQKKVMRLVSSWERHQVEAGYQPMRNGVVRVPEALSNSKNLSTSLHIDYSATSWGSHHKPKD